VYIIIFIIIVIIIIIIFWFKTTLRSVIKLSDLAD